MLCFVHSNVHCRLPSVDHTVVRPRPCSTYTASSIANSSAGSVTAGAISVTRFSDTPSWPESWMNAALHPRSSHHPSSMARRSGMK